MPKSPDDLEGLKTERAAADRVYNDALTRLDAAIRAFPDRFPAQPPAPDVHQLSSLNTRWKITSPPAEPGLRGRFAAAVRRFVAPLFDQQEAFNGAVVDHLNRNVPVQQASGESLDAGLTILREHLAELARFQTLLIVFLQQITPYVDTRDRDVAGLLRGLSGAIDAVSNELLKRSEALLARDYQHDRRLSEMEVELREVRARLAELQERAADERPATSPPR
jgi:uncharacterized coiled-coil protein SlyX